MKRLYLFRHAKAERGAAGGEDHARALTGRGMADALAVATLVFPAFPPPRLVLCSTSTRTRQTLAAALPRLGEPEVAFEDRLYLASAGLLLAVVNATAPDEDPLMMIGHNDGIGHLARLLCGAGPAAELDLLGAKMPTAGLAVIAFEIEAWDAVAPGAGRLERFVTPNMIE